MIGHSVDGRAIHVVEIGTRGQPRDPRRRLHPRERVRRDGGHPRAPATVASEACRPLARPDAQPRRPGRGDEAERPRRRPEPQLRRRLDAARRTGEHVLLGAEPVLGARDAGRAPADHGHPAEGHDLVPPAHAARLDVGEERAAGPNVRNDGRPAALRAQLSGRRGVAVDPGAVPAPARLRGRARGRAALARRRPPACERRARDGRLPETLASGTGVSPKWRRWSAG